MNNVIDTEYLPDVISPPGETLHDILEERGMTQSELAERTGRPKKTINEIIKGKTTLTPDTAIQLERVLGTPASFWINRERNYQEWLARQREKQRLEEYVPWMKKFPINEMIKFGWIKKRQDHLGKVEELLNYFGIVSPKEWEKVYESTQWRRSLIFDPNKYSISAWLRQGEIQAMKLECNQYSEVLFRQALISIRSLTTELPAVFIGKLVEYCSNVGVAVVFVPELSGTHAFGATRWITSDKAMILLSLRYKTDDHLWFTFFHEAAHILLHGKKDAFLENGSSFSEKTVDGIDSINYKKEEEANQFSANLLIPKEKYDYFYQKGNFSRSEVIKFAEEIEVAPGIVVGRLQYDKIIEYNVFNDLKKKLEWPILEDNK